MWLTRLREVRLLVPMTVEELAKKSGVAADTIESIEEGAPTRPPTAEKLAKALGASMLELEGTATSTPSK